MHGYNEPRGVESVDKGYQVHDIWYTIQGEGPFAGLPAVFVRLTGCNLKCNWCDTTWDDEKDPYCTVDEIFNKIKLSSLDCRLVVLTGGEPCRWDLAPLIEELFIQDYKVQIETAGTLWQNSLLKSNVTVVCSPKISKVHPKIFKYVDHWKYVIKSGDASLEDGLPIEGTQRRQWAGNLKQAQEEKIPIFVGGPMARPPKDRKVEIYLQPCDEGDKAKNLANTAHMVEIAMKYGYRAGLQLHKIFNVL